ncbi:MAG: hypothetical protein HOW73_12020 [Polyangiaceae bacterium]|nr:hypothetical protein [Polyangiaceae bacterium]
MKNGVCPKCESSEIYVVDELKIPNYEYSNSVVPLTLTAHYGETGETGFLGSAKMERVGINLRALVCGDCAFTEVYVDNLDRLKKFAAQRQGGVRRYKPEADE